LGEKEGDLERIKSELDTSDLPVVRSIEERTAPLEAEIKDLRSEISKLRGEMAQKDVAAGEATELLRAQLRETADALAATEKALADAKTREKSLTEKGTAGDAERARAAQDAAAAARRDSNSLREQLADAQMKLEAKVAESKQKEEAARKSVDDARQIEAESRRAAETAQAQVQEVETALRAKEKELETALVRAGESDRKQLSLVAVVEELTEQIASAKAKMDEKTREIADLRAFVPGPERQSEFNDALAQLEAKERDLLESKGRIKSLESDLANAESPERGFKLKNLVSRLKLDRNEAAKSAARRADELATKETELIAVRAEIDRVKAELEDMKAFVPGPEQQSEFGAALETIAGKRARTTRVQGQNRCLRSRPRRCREGPRRGPGERRGHAARARRGCRRSRGCERQSESRERRRRAGPIAARRHEGAARARRDGRRRRARGTSRGAER
jgi:colicin import membrane protein